jgi:hypothetical protein
MAKQESLFAVTVYYRKANGICAKAIIFFIINCLKMQLRLKNLYKRLFFSAETSFILNNLTLQITDVEINQLYNEALRDNFYKIWKPVTIVALFNLCVRVYQISFVRDTPPIRLMGAFLRLSFCLMWGLLKWKFRNFKMPALLVFLYSLAWCMITNFSFRDQMPHIMIENDRKAD